MDGWICLYRSIQKHWIWQDPVKLKWWLDILLMANHEERKIFIKDDVFIIERGEHHTSEIKLAERWNVDRKTVDKFLALLEKDGMISTRKSRKYGTTLKVANYRDFQDVFKEHKNNSVHNTLDNSIHNSEDNTVDISSHNTTGNSMDINNNDKQLNNDNNDNNGICAKGNSKKVVRHKYGSYQNVYLSDEELAKLKAEFGDWEKRIERVSEYCASTGKSYKNYLATIRNWAKKDISQKGLDNFISCERDLDFLIE